MTSSNQSLQEAFHQAIQLCEQGDLQQAEKICEQILLAAPNQPDALTLLGIISSQLGDDERTIDCFRKIINKYPNNAEAHFNLAKAFKKLERFQEAKESYEQALKFNANDLATLINYGYVCTNLADWENAFRAFRQALLLKRQPGNASKSTVRTFTETTRAKLRHDIEQLTYLNSKGSKITNGASVIKSLTELMEWIPGHAADGQVLEIPSMYLERLEPIYNRLVAMHEAERLPSGAINPSLDKISIEENYQHNEPGITFVDDLLTPKALESLRRFCLESTIWFEFGYKNGYLGSFMEDGFLTPILVQIAEELPRALPGIFHDHKLSYLWAYKYDSRMTGINLHGDDAVINVNFWITPDDTNRDHDTGGLIVWNKEAPADWDFLKMNADYEAMRQFLSEANAQNISVPHKQNRAVIFNSDLFHETDEINFHEGYENRRINITMLFGRSRNA